MAKNNMILLLTVFLAGVTLLSSCTVGPQCNSNNIGNLRCENAYYKQECMQNGTYNTWTRIELCTSVPGNVCVVDTCAPGCDHTFLDGQGVSHTIGVPNGAIGCLDSSILGECIGGTVITTDCTLTSQTCVSNACV